MTVNLVQGFRTTLHPKHNVAIGIYPEAKYLVIRIPSSRALVLLGRSFILALIIVTVPWLNSIVLPALAKTSEYDGAVDTASSTAGAPNIDLLTSMFRDLANEGLFKSGHGEKAVYFSSGDNDIKEVLESSKILSDYHMDLISLTDEEILNSVNDGTVDFAYVDSVLSSAVKFLKRTVKVGGIVAFQLSEDPNDGFHMPSSYKMVYLRRFDGATVVAMRKMASSLSTTTTPTRRRLLSQEAKKEALKNLEDVLLEPPRAASGKSSRYLKRTRYLPDLMGDTLEGYPRRVFIDVGLPEKEGGSGTGWFAKNYPTRNKNFEMYKIETAVADVGSGKETGMSEWLAKNVKEEEYVVMKAEAEVVEEIMKSKVTNLVDELFLECKPHRHNEKGNVSTRRAYWQCLALYGQLRDQGVAVHQWWG